MLELENILVRFWCWSIVKWLNRAAGTSLAEAPHGVRIPKKLLERCVRFDLGTVSMVFCLNNDRPPLLEITHEFSQVRLRGRDVEFHDRFKQDGMALLECLFKAVIRSNPEGDVIESFLRNFHIEQAYLDLHEGITGDGPPPLGTGLEFLEDGCQEFRGDIPRCCKVADVNGLVLAARWFHAECQAGRFLLASDMAVTLAH